MTDETTLSQLTEVGRQDVPNTVRLSRRVGADVDAIEKKPRAMLAALDDSLAGISDAPTRSEVRTRAPPHRMQSKWHCHVNRKA